MVPVKIKSVLITLFCLLSLAMGASWAKTPLELLTLAKGEVEYSKDGAKWKRVTRNKLLFDGYRVRTADDASAKLINQDSGTSRDLGASSEVIIKRKGLSVVKGELSAPSSADSKLLKGMKKRFAKAQRYTTVRRSVEKLSEWKLESARKLVLSAVYPDLVWRNMGSDYHYRLSIDGNTQVIPSSEADMMRHILALTPGKHRYSIDLMQGKKVLYTPKHQGELVWLGNEEAAQLKADLERLTTLSGGDDFILGIYLEDAGITVAAMDKFRNYFDGNQDNDLRPMLIKVYHSLKLRGLRQAEAQRYNEVLTRQ